MRASEQQWSSLLSHNPAVLDVVRHDRSHIELKTQNGYVRFRLRKLELLFSGKEWLVTDSNTAESTPVVLKSKRRLSKVVTLKHETAFLATLSKGLFGSETCLCWESETYRWIKCPGKLILVNSNTDKVHAIMGRPAETYPWSRNQGSLMIFGSTRDSKWMRVVIGSALAEAASKSSWLKSAKSETKGVLVSHKYLGKVHKVASFHK